MSHSAAWIAALTFLIPIPLWAQDGQGPSPDEGDGKKPPQEGKQEEFEDWFQEKEKPSQDLKALFERWGLGTLNAFARTRAATRLHDRQVTSGKESDSFDLAQHENTLWAELTNKTLAKWAEFKLLGRVLYDSSFALNDDVDVDSARDELEFDPDLREAYADLFFDNLTVRVGRQIVVWGESDLFRVNDWANPVDLRRGFFGSLEELREPLWMVSARYGTMNWAFEMVVNPGDYQEDQVAPEGAEFYPDEAWADLRRNTWQRVNSAIYGQVLAATPPPLKPLVPNPIVLENNVAYVNHDELPDRQLRNAEGGVRLRYQLDDWDLGLMYFHTIADRPVLETESIAFNPGPPVGPLPGAFVVPDNTVTITTRLKYPDLNVLGASFSKDIEMGILRGEIAWSIDEQFSRKAPLGLGIVERNALRYLLAFDRPTYIPWIAPDRTALLSLQVWQQYLRGAEDDEIIEVPFQDTIEDFVTAFSLIAQFAYLEDRLQPQVVYTRDTMEAELIAASVSYKVDNSWQVALGASFFDGPDNHGFGLFDDRDQISLSLTYYY